MPNALDLSLMTLLVAAGAWDHFVAWPRFARAVAAGERGVRTRFYRAVAIGEWLFAAAVIATWVHAHRPFAALGLTMPTGVRLAAGVLVCALGAGLVALQTRQIAALPPERLVRAGARLSGPIAALLPHSPGERNAFMPLSLTAGVCEELVARGYVLWFIGAWTGPWVALVLSSALFGLGHAYQGRSGVVKTGLVGLVMGLVYLGTGSLLPGMVLHTLIDVGSGIAGYALLRERPVS